MLQGETYLHKEIMKTIWRWELGKEQYTIFKWYLTSKVWEKKFLKEVEIKLFTLYVVYIQSYVKQLRMNE